MRSHLNGGASDGRGHWAVIAAALTIAVAAAGAEPGSVRALRAAAEGSFLVGVGPSDSIPARPQDWPLLLSQFNCLTLENSLKPDPVERVGGRFQFSQPDAVVEFATSNPLQVVGHCLVWAKDDRTPAWFYRDGTNVASGELLLARMKQHIDTVVGRYRGRIAMWDVVNEALNDGKNYLRSSGWSQACGEEFIVRAFEFAHAADPQAFLIYNDCNKELTDKRAKLLRLIARVSFWNLHDGQSWLNEFPWRRVNHPLLFDRAGKPKPAFHAGIAEARKAATTAQPRQTRAPTPPFL